MTTPRDCYTAYQEAMEYLGYFRLRYPQVQGDLRGLIADLAGYEARPLSGVAGTIDEIMERGFNRTRGAVVAGAAWSATLGVDRSADGIVYRSNACEDARGMVHGYVAGLVNAAVTTLDLCQNRGCTAERLPKYRAEAMAHVPAGFVGVQITNPQVSNDVETFNLPIDLARQLCWLYEQYLRARRAAAAGLAVNNRLDTIEGATRAMRELEAAIGVQVIPYYEFADAS